MTAKKRIFIIGSCVTRDLFDMTERYEIVEYVARTSLASAFDDKPFPVASGDLLEKTIESNWQRKCVHYDLTKALPGLLREKSYDAVVMDFVDERFKLLLCNAGEKATLSPEFALTGLHAAPGMKTLRPANRRRWQWWKEGLNDLLSIMRARNIPVFLNEVYPAACDNVEKPFHRWSVLRENLRLRWFYRQVPAYVTRFKVPADIFVGDAEHKWGRNPFHYTAPVYVCLLNQLDNALNGTCDFSKKAA